jgi:hypothetical protein
MRLVLLRAVAALCFVIQVSSITHLRKAVAREQDHGDDARAFADKSSSTLELLSKAADQVLLAPGVAQETRFGNLLKKASSQLRESGKILQKWGVDYKHNEDANEMALTLAQQGAEYEVQDLKRQLRAAIEADQERRMDEPSRLAALSEKVAGLRSRLSSLRANQKPQVASTALLSEAWPRPPENATKAEIGLFMHSAKMRSTKREQDDEDEEHLAKLESRLDSLDNQLQAVRSSVVATHANTLDAKHESEVASK